MLVLMGAALRIHAGVAGEGEGVGVHATSASIAAHGATVARNLCSTPVL